MSKAMAIKGVDFSTNKLTTITFEGDHTTAIALSQSTLSFDTVGDTETLNATLTPETSVDPVVWTSSNGNVATVSEGVVTATGIGTCTITATSGSYSATCTVTVAVYLNGTAYPKTITDPIGSGNNWYTKTICDIGISSATNDAYISLLTGVQTYNGELLCGKMAQNVAETGYDFQIIPPNGFENNTNEKRCYDNIGYPIPLAIPTGTTKIKCIALSAQYAARVMFFDTNTRALNTPMDVNGAQYYCAFRQKYTPTAADYTWVYENNLEFDVPSGYNAVVVVWKVNPNDPTAVLPKNLTSDQLAQFKAQCI